jgi:hypothetical protein
MVSFMPQLLYPWSKSLQYPLDRRLDGPQSQSGCGGKEENIPSLSLPGIEPQSSSPHSSSVLPKEPIFKDLLNNIQVVKICIFIIQLVFKKLDC